MVATASDSPATGGGFAGDASPAMPAYGAAEMPMAADDAALSDPGMGVEAAPEIPDVPFDVATLDDAQRDFLAQHFGAQYEAKFNEDKRNLQQTYERQKYRLSNELEAQKQNTAMQEATVGKLLAWAHQYAQQHGDPRDVESLMNDILVGQMQEQQRIQRTNQTFNEWRVAESKAHEQHLLDRSQNGRLFDPEDREIFAQYQQYDDAYRRHLMATGGVKDMNHPSYVPVAHAWMQMKAVEDRKALEGEARLNRMTQTQQRVTTAQQQQQVRQMQQQRGPQNVARGGQVPSTPMSGAEIRKKAASMVSDPNDQAAVYLKSLELLRQQGQ